MSERWVHPPVLAREAAPAWIATWRFRVVALMLLTVVVVLAVLAFAQLSGLTAEDPGLGGALPVGGLDAART